MKNSMIQFTTTLHKFDKQGEKTSWTYLEISAKQAHQLKPNCKVSFRTKEPSILINFKRLPCFQWVTVNLFCPSMQPCEKQLEKVRRQDKSDDGSGRS